MTLIVLFVINSVILAGYYNQQMETIINSQIYICLRIYLGVELILVSSVLSCYKVTSWKDSII